MSRFILLAISIFSLSCGPKIVSKLSNNKNYVAEDIVILDLEDSKPEKADSLGYIKVGDGGISVNCSYEKGIETIKKQAINSGGNLVKITKLKIPDKWSTCYRIEATVFNVDNNKKYEKIIAWSEERKLIYDDFKAKVRPISVSNSLTAAVTSSIFSYEVKKINIFNSKVKECSVKNYFNCRNSWFDENFKNNSVLEHEQLHFDASELVARKFRKYLKEKYSEPVLQGILENEFRIFNNDLNSFQNKYDSETDNGRNGSKQAKWKEAINKELRELSAYKSDLIKFGE